MKVSLFFIALFALALGSCATYKSGQTPDDVYYSPANERPANDYTRQDDNNYDNNDASVVSDNDGNSYVTYDDGSDQGISYTQRFQMFDNPYGFSYAPSYFNNFYSPYGGLYNPYMTFYQPYGWGMSFSPFNYYSPYYSYSFGLGIGSGLYYGGYNPWMYNSWYNPYYYGGYGYYSGKGYVNLRPSSTYSPRRSASSPAANGVYNNTTRSFNVNNPGQPRRVFVQPSNGEVTTSGNVNSTVNTQHGSRRVFIQRNDERPVNVNNNSTNHSSTLRISRHNNFTPANDTRTTTRTFERVQPRNNTNYNNNNSNFNSSSNSSGGGSSTPSRTFAPRH